MNASLITAGAVVSCTALLCCSTANAQAHSPVEAGAEPLPNAPLDSWLRRLVGSYKLEGAANMTRCVRAAGGSDCSSVKGKVDCIAIGTGPGVHCILNAEWIDVWDNQGEPVAISYLNPSMMLLGLDPGKSAINMLLVNNKGLPEGTFGRIKGNTATFNSPCVNTPVFDMSSLRAAVAESAANSSNSSESDAGSPLSTENSFASPGGGALYADSSEVAGSGSNCSHTVRIEAKADANLIYMWTQPNDVLLQLRRVPPVGVSAAAAK